MTAPKELDSALVIPAVGPKLANAAVPEPPSLSLLCMVGLLLAGCGFDGDLAKVKGRVTLHGQPLEGVVVQFQPTGGSGSSSSGITDSEGRYELMFTFTTPGAVPGEHIVSIRTAEAYYEDGRCTSETGDRVPAKYNSRTELRRTVEPGKNVIDFDL